MDSKKLIPAIGLVVLGLLFLTIALMIVIPPVQSIDGGGERKTPVLLSSVFFYSLSRLCLYRETPKPFKTVIVILEILVFAIFAIVLRERIIF